MTVKSISVVMATFNGAKYIIKQLDSILQQTLKPDEIIICDDNSSDETVSLIKSYKDSSRIKMVINSTRLGVVENFKKAAKLAEPSNWLVFADQDDIWVPQKLSKLANSMSAIDDGFTPALVYSDLTVIDKNGAVTASSFWYKQKIRPEKINLSTLLYGNVVTGCTTMVNNPMAEELFLFNGRGYFHDEWLGLIAYSFGKAKVLNEALVFYRQHENNVTFSEEYKTPEFADSLKEDFSYLLKKKKFLAHQFNLAKAFLLVYRDKLNAEQIKIFENFISQENKNYLLQRINRRITYS
jgi:glycosyltransferase involved in cell wall biosynthesis